MTHTHFCKNLDQFSVSVRFHYFMRKKWCNLGFNVRDIARSSNSTIKTYEGFFFTKSNLIVIFYAESWSFPVMFLDMLSLFFFKICRIRILDKIFLMCFPLIKFYDSTWTTEKRYLECIAFYFYYKNLIVGNFGSTYGLYIYSMLL